MEDIRLLGLFTRINVLHDRCLNSLKTLAGNADYGFAARIKAHPLEKFLYPTGSIETDSHSAGCAEMQRVRVSSQDVSMSILRLQFIYLLSAAARCRRHERKRKPPRSRRIEL